MGTYIYFGDKPNVNNSSAIFKYYPMKEIKKAPNGAFP